MNVFRARPGRDGLWDFLGKRAAARNRVKLEETRNQGTQEAIRALPPGGVLREGGANWSREIRIPHQPPPTVIAVTTIRPIVPPAGAQRLEAPADQSGEASGETRGEGGGS
jgi:hypothetical protein